MIGAMNEFCELKDCRALIRLNDPSKYLALSYLQRTGSNPRFGLGSHGFGFWLDRIKLTSISESVLPRN